MPNAGEEIGEIMRVFIIPIILGIFLLFLCSCAQVSAKDDGSNQKAVGDILIRPSWEKNHPERQEWTNVLVGLVSESYWGAFDSARDVERIYPGYSKLSKEKKLTVWAEFFSQLAKYESSWNPGSAGVDVGKPGDKNTWSICLFQLSVVDQEWVDPKTSYTYAELLEPKKCINLAVRIMARQILRCRDVLLPNESKCRYWAVILDGNKYQKIAPILSSVQALKL